MITVYHLAHSRSQRILWLLEELGLPYRVERFARDPQTMRASKEYRAIHPLGKSPVIRDGDLVLASRGRSSSTWSSVTAKCSQCK